MDEGPNLDALQFLHVLESSERLECFELLEVVEVVEVKLKYVQLFKSYTTWILTMVSSAGATLGLRGGRELVRCSRVRSLWLGRVISWN